jgi:membrane fusion protein, multidrug efflux system
LNPIVLSHPQLSYRVTVVSAKQHRLTIVIYYVLLAPYNLKKIPKQTVIMTKYANTMATQRPFWCTATKTITLLLLLLAAPGCGKKNGPAERGAKRAPAIQIRTTMVQRVSVQREVDLAGTLISPDQARVSSEVAGVVRSVLVELGQEVQPGQTMVKLEPRELELALQRAESQLRQTEAQLGIDGSRIREVPPDDQIAAIRTAIANREDARAQLARATSLFSQGLLARADLDTMQTRMKVMEAAYQATMENTLSLKASLAERRAAHELAQKKLNDAVIKAPVGGQVSERLVQPGEFIRENTPVIGIVQINPLKLKTAIQERYAALIAPNLPALFKVESFPDATFTGKVAFISPAVDQATRTFPVEIIVDNRDRRLKPGFFAKGVIHTQRDENVLAVPEDAISTLAGVSTVYVIEKNKARQQIVTLGAHPGKLVEIVTGLAGSEVLATTNLSLLATGVSVETGPSSNADSPSHHPDVRGAISSQGGQP